MEALGALKLPSCREGLLGGPGNLALTRHSLHDPARASAKISGKRILDEAFHESYLASYVNPEHASSMLTGDGSSHPPIAPQEHK